MARQYQRFVKILEKWPADETKLSKTLGIYLREQGQIVFDRRGEFKGDRVACDQRLASLERISRDHWASKYPRSRQSSATGFTLDQCNRALNKATVQELESLMESSLPLRSIKMMFKRD